MRKMNLKVRIKGSWHVMPFVLIAFLCFMIIPSFDWTKNNLILMIALIFPILSFVLCVVHTLIYSRHGWLPVLIALAFIPAVYSHYNGSALFYVLVYWLAGFLGGNLVYGIKVWHQWYKDNTV